MQLKVSYKPWDHSIENLNSLINFLRNQLRHPTFKVQLMMKRKLLSSWEECNGQIERRNG